MKGKLTWVVRFDVSKEWVADGFALTNERALRLLASDLDHACMDTEIKASVIAAPSPLIVAREQGYTKNHPGSGQVIRELIDGAPTSGGLDNALCDAIQLIDSVAFVRDEGDNTQAVLTQLRNALGLIRGTNPIQSVA